MVDAAVTPAHDQKFSHSYIVHFPDHAPRTSDPHYVDFNHYHRLHRKTARCFVGEKIGFGDCRNNKGEACPAPADPCEQQDGLELHHAYVEFSLQNGIDLSALEKDFPGISDPDNVGAWVESDQNFRWLCVFHHRAAGGAHTASHSDWTAQQYVPHLISGITESK